MSLLTRNLDLFDPIDAKIGEIEDAAGKLEAIGDFIRECELCPLSRNRRHAVPGEGDPEARLLIAGEGPGESEDELGRPFVGKAGALLDKILAAAEIERQSVFITNIVKCRAAEMAEGRLQNRAPLISEVNACRPYLIRQVEVIQPAVILCLGNAAAKGVIDATFNITEQRGKWFDGPFGSRLIATYHPAFILRRGGAGSGARELKKMVWEDIKMVTGYLSEGD